ncbi:MAG: hypothetical protein E7022_02455 [Desulfovibrio desulfuricans]|nr:hypothetical protein [Desulfovibrio desulfuricans]
MVPLSSDTGFSPAEAGNAAAGAADDVTARPGMARWPQWAEAFRLDDDMAAAAYEATPARLRAVVKTGLALAHMRFGEATEERCGEVRNANLGFWRAATAAPVPWAVVAFTPQYAAAARLTAACAAARLGGAPLVGAACVGGAPAQAALVSLELSGVEDVFTLDAAGLRALLAETAPAPGRLVLLHTGALDETARAARELGIPCFEERRPPALSLPQPEAFDLEALAFAQAEAYDSARAQGASGTPTDSAFAAAGLPDALYLPAEAARTACLHGRPPAPLLLTPGCEGFWLHPGLSPAFFRTRCEGFGAL